MGNKTFVTPVVAVFIFCIIMQMASAFDLWNYIANQIRNTVEKEGINCANYKRFCQRNEQEPEFEDAVALELNQVAGSLCEAILKDYVCS